jgi:predicted DNA-binding helix-hairpin-helix protein
LSLDTDPKTGWAERHPEFFPVDVNAAPREALLRVPGIGYRNVDRILRIRRYHRLSLEDLRKLHVRVRQTSAYIVTTDHIPSSSIDTALEQSTAIPLAPGGAQIPPVQMEMFAATSALTGQV